MFRAVHFGRTQLMGVLNITPDSYYDGGKYISPDKAIEHAYQMVKDGADIIDIGGESTRPFSDSVDEEEELKRVIPVIKALSKEITVPISIDTQKPRVARAAMESGASWFNSISGFQNPLMVQVAIDFDVPICVMHMQKNPENMQLCPSYPEGVVKEILEWMKKTSKSLISQGVKEKNIIFDPGIGFGKTVDDNIKIIKHLSDFKKLGFPILLGISRKSFIQKILEKKASEVLSTTLAANTIVLGSGVDIIRVHDVKEHRQIIDFLSYFQEIEKEPIIGELLTKEALPIG
jgi:dihydropteroate synthase